MIMSHTKNFLLTMRSLTRGVPDVIALFSCSLNVSPALPKHGELSTGNSTSTDLVFKVKAGEDKQGSRGSRFNFSADRRKQQRVEEGISSVVAWVR